MARAMSRKVLLHALAFVLANALLALAWWLRAPRGDYWPLPVHLAWGALLVLHWASDLIRRTHRVD